MKLSSICAVLSEFVFVLSITFPANAADCNSNSVEDSIEVALRGYQIGSTFNVPLKTVAAGIDAVSLRLVPNNVADFDGDGALDLWGSTSYFSAGSLAGMIFIYFNRGDNTFEDPLEIAFDDSAAIASILIGNVQISDINGDGRPDFVFTKDRTDSQGGTFDVEVLRNNGAREFAVEQTNIGSLLPPRISSGETILVPKDIAPNTVNDLVLIYQENYYAFYQIAPYEYLRFFMGPAIGTTGIVVRSEGPGGPMLAYNARGVTANAGAATVGTISRDDRIYNPGGRIMAYISQGSEVYQSGIFGIRAERPANGTDPGSTALTFQGFSGYPLELPMVRSSIGGVRKVLTSFDFDLDGRNDIALLGPNAVQVLFNDSDFLLYSEHELFTSRVTIPPPASDNIPMAVGNFNNDALPDTFYISADGTTGIIALNNSTLPYLPAESADLDANWIPDTCERAIPLDFDGDRVSDFAVVRGTAPLSWFVQPRSLVSKIPDNLSFQFGLPGDTVLAGDFEGRGKTRPGVVRTELGGLSWYWLDSNNITNRLQFGLAGDLPVAGYFDSDQALDRAVIRRIGGDLHWYIRRSTAPDSFVEFNWGLPGDVAFAADFNGDKIDEAVVARRIAGGVYWFVRNLAGTYSFSMLWGLSSDTIFSPADTNGDSLAGLIVARSDGTTTQVYSSDGFADSNVLSVGKGGDQIFALAHSGIGVTEFASRDSYRGFPVTLLERVSQSGSRYSSPLGFGFHTDTILGTDGRVAQTVGFRGALRCQTILPTYTGMGGYAWVGTQPGKPQFFIPPSLVSQTKAVKIFSSRGVQLDTMKLADRKTGRYTAKTYTREQLQSFLGALTPGSPPADALVAQVELKNGIVQCEVVPFAADAN